MLIDAADDAYPTELQDIKIPLMSDADCNAVDVIADAGGVNDTTMVCAGYPSDDVTICSVSVIQPRLAGDSHRCQCRTRQLPLLDV